MHRERWASPKIRDMRHFDFQFLQLLEPTQVCDPTIGDLGECKVQFLDAGQGAKVANPSSLIFVSSS